MGTVFEFLLVGLEALHYSEHGDYEVLKHRTDGGDDVPVRVNVYTKKDGGERTTRQVVQYVSPGDPEKLSHAELLVIDEAAALPLPTVKKLLGPYVVFLASTVTGYEGTGRALQLKLIAQLRAQHARRAVTEAAADAADGVRGVAHAKKGDHDPFEHGNASLCVAPLIQLKEKLKVRLIPKGESGGKRAFFLMSQGLRQHPMVELVGSPYRLCKDRGYTLDNKHSNCEKDIRKLGEKAPDADVAIVVMPANDPKFYSSGRAAAFLPYRWGTNKKLAADPVEDVGTTNGYEKITHADENPTLYRYAPPVPANRMIFVDEADWASSHAHVRDDAAQYLAYFKRSWVDKRDAVPVRASGSRHARSKSYFPMPYALALSLIHI